MNATTASPEKASQIKKLVLLGLFFVFWLWADLWTKHWADTRLADPRHPIAVTVEASDEGKTIGELITERLALQPGKDTERTLAHVFKLPPMVEYTPETRVFGSEEVPQDTRGFYVFWRSDQSLPPRRLDRTDRLLANRWLAVSYLEKAKLTEGYSEFSASEDFADQATQYAMACIDEAEQALARQKLLEMNTQGRKVPQKKKRRKKRRTPRSP